MSAAQTPRERMVTVVARKLMTQHNGEYAIGTQRDSFVEPPIWMTRKAETIISALADAGLVGEEEFVWFDRLYPHRMADAYTPIEDQMPMHRLVTRWEQVK